MHAVNELNDLPGKSMKNDIWKCFLSYHSFISLSHVVLNANLWFKRPKKKTQKLQEHSLFWAHVLKIKISESGEGLERLRPVSFVDSTTGAPRKVSVTMEKHILPCCLFQLLWVLMLQVILGTRLSFQRFYTSFHCLPFSPISGSASTVWIRNT